MSLTSINHFHKITELNMIYMSNPVKHVKLTVREHHAWYFLMMASSFFVVASGQRFGAVKIACCSAEPHLQSRSDSRNRLRASRRIVWAFRTFLFKYSTTVSTLTASCPGCQQS